MGWAEIAIAVRAKCKVGQASPPPFGPKRPYNSADCHPDSANPLRSIPARDAVERVGTAAEGVEEGVPTAGGRRAEVVRC
jgi:hypothetical protein